MLVRLQRRDFLIASGGAVLTQGIGCADPSPAPRTPSNWQGPERAAPPVVIGDAPSSSEPVAEVAAPAPNRLRLPERSASAEPGSVFLERTEGLGRSAMDDATSEAILSGNVPEFLRQLLPLRLEHDGDIAEIFVTCDYMAIGSDDDFVRMPMTSAAAQRIADVVDASLPTPLLVDEIYRQSKARLHPNWIDGGPTYGTLADWSAHQSTLEESRKKHGIELGELIAGHKKDIVLAAVLLENPDRMAIYGWHKKEGDVVQPLSTAHFLRYADYSHGVRLIQQQMKLNGEDVLFSDVLREPHLCWLLCDDGPLSVTEYDTELPPS